MGEEPHRESGAAAAAAQVRAILEAAERETEAQLRRVLDSAERLSGRADEIERELERLSEGVRGAIHDLRRELAELRPGAGSPEPPAPPDPPGPPDPPETSPVPVPPAAEAAPDAGPDPAAAPDGARVIALNMALRGAPRDETARYLAENFDLPDPEALLDEVYARAGQ